MRVNVGSFEFTEADGTIWVADTFRGGAGIGAYTVADTVEIEGTENDALYHSELYGAFTFSVPVEAPGKYEIVMHFAELFHPAEGSRIFDIKLEGKTVLNDLDVVAVTGAPFTALQYSFFQSITDGSVDIEGVNIVDNAKLNGVEIFLLPDTFELPTTEAPTVAPTDAPTAQGIVTIAKLNCGSFQFEEAPGVFWMEDAFFTGGISFNIGNAPIAGTDNDALYQSERWGDLTYSIPVETGRTYEIVMHFAELFHTTAGQRIFDVVLEGETVLKDLDLVAELGGSLVAQEYTFQQVITDGSIDITIVSTKDFGKINGLEVYMLPVV